jgi:phospholipid transport system substrate-binding protein
MGRLSGAVGAVLFALVLPVAAQDAGPDPLVHRIARDGLVQHLDFDEATRLAAGPIWAQASAEQRKRLVAEFGTMLVRLYLNAIKLYPGQNLRALPSRGEGVVRAQLSGPGGQAVPVDFHVRNGKVYDINVDGVSLVRAYRADFDAAVKQGGIDGLIKRLAEKNAKT